MQKSNLTKELQLRVKHRLRKHTRQKHRRRMLRDHQKYRKKKKKEKKVQKLQPASRKTVQQNLVYKSGWV